MSSLFINSRERVDGTSGDYVVNLSSPLKIGNTLSLLDITFKNCIYNIDYSNNIFYMKVRLYDVLFGPFIDNPFTAELDPGTYSKNDLITALASKIAASMSSQYPEEPAIQVLITEKEYNSTFEIKCLTAYYNGSTVADKYVLWLVCDKSLISNYENSVNKLMGFEEIEYPVNYVGPSSYNGYTSSRPSDLTKFKFIYLCSDVFTNNNGSNQMSRNILCKVPLPTYNSILYYETPDNQMKIKITHEKPSIRIYFLDEWMQPVNFNGADNSITFRIEK